MSWFSLSLFVSNGYIFFSFLVQVCLANEIYKMLRGSEVLASGRNQVCSLASYLYIACRQEDKTRSIKSTKKFWFICIYSNSWQLELETGQSVEMGTIHAGDFMVSSS
ncbi:unnamed protein product [Brassica napus]|uniref:(rape) hypothetical protein n=1 Tax=Brassica napus TaxID=3708 RepID=A0A817AWM9_BRANA|nr:unnamed protein product [Brassica napus]